MTDNLYSRLVMIGLGSILLLTLAINISKGTWPPGHWKIGGGDDLGIPLYDPESNVIFYGTGNPGSWNPELRPGDNKWTCGIFARDADTGQAVWFYQTSPHDEFDHDGINECMLLDLKVDGPDKPARKCLVHPGRTGYMYVLDRLTGQVISAEPFGRITAANGVDLKTGRLQVNEEKEPKMGNLDAFTKRASHRDVAQSMDIAGRLRDARNTLAKVVSAEYVERLRGTISATRWDRSPAPAMPATPGWGTAHV